MGYAPSVWICRAADGASVRRTRKREKGSEYLSGAKTGKTLEP
jgi:hypothetical protein